MSGEVCIGTSGYTFPDWVGPFYPPGTPRGKMLDYYALHFGTVEINASYYGIPKPAVFQHMHQKTGDTFEFLVKVNREATHGRGDDGASMRALYAAVEPLREAGKLRGFVAQFPWSFRRTPANTDYLRKLCEQSANAPLFVEFRHDSWLLDTTYEMLTALQVGYVCVDEPRLRGLLPPQDTATSSIGYVRLHGRNSAAWWDQTRGDRYDYLYNEAELQDWTNRILRLRSRTLKTYVFFNNCYQGQAVKNARMLIEMLKRQLVLP